MEKMKFSFDDIYKNPIKFLAPIYPYFFVVIIGFGLWYINNMSVISRNNLTPAGPDTTAVTPELTIQEPRIASALDMNSITNPSPDFIEKGKGLYINTCGSCHGNEGKGDGVAGAVMNPKPRNFHENTGWKNGRKFTEMYSTLEKGLGATGMPGYDYMSVEDRVAIIQYMRKTFMVDAPVNTQAEIAELDKKYSLTAGKQVAGTIPIVNAGNLIQQEFIGKAQSIEKVITKLRGMESANNSAKLFFIITSNEEKAVLTLMNSDKWLLGEKEFSTIISSDLSVNGFNSNVFSLSGNELRDVFSLLKSVIHS